MPRYHLDQAAKGVVECNAMVSCAYGDLQTAHWNSISDAWAAFRATYGVAASEGALAHPEVECPQCAGATTTATLGALGHCAACEQESYRGEDDYAVCPSCGKLTTEKAIELFDSCTACDEFRDDCKGCGDRRGWYVDYEPYSADPTQVECEPCWSRRHAYRLT